MNIRNCPHCNGEADPYRDYFSAGDFDLDGIYLIMVKCSVCGATGKEYEVEYDVWNDWDALLKATETKDAIKAWNMRTLTSDIEELIDERIALALDNAPETRHNAAGDAETP